jgi:multiple sugar transport system ATP-binding protein
MSFLKIENVTKSYGAVEVLHRVNINVAEGEFLLLVGPLGCGRSTLLNMIVAQNIAFGLEMHGAPKPERESAMARVSDMLQITPLLNRKSGQFPGGQRQRVAMGRALVRDPDVFLFDHPLSNFDTKLRVNMRTEIKKLHLRLGTTIAYVTHDQIKALTLSARIAAMIGGYIQQLGTPKEIYDNPCNIFVASFMDSPSMNLIPARVRANGSVAQVEISDADGQPEVLPVSASADALRPYKRTEIVLDLRPRR